MEIAITYLEWYAIAPKILGVTRPHGQIWNRRNSPQSPKYVGGEIFLELATQSAVVVSLVW